MIEYVLSVARSVAEPSEYLYELRVYSVDTKFKDGCFALFLYVLLDFLGGLFDYLFYSCGMYPAVYYELFKGEPCYLSSHRIEA